jgi:hypothetical protein
MTVPPMTVPLMTVPLMIPLPALVVQVIAAVARGTAARQGATSAATGRR